MWWDGCGVILGRRSGRWKPQPRETTFITGFCSGSSLLDLLWLRRPCLWVLLKLLLSSACFFRDGKWWGSVAQWHWDSLLVLLFHCSSGASVTFLPHSTPYSTYALCSKHALARWLASSHFTLTFKIKGPFNWFLTFSRKLGRKSRTWEAFLIK